MQNFVSEAHKQKDSSTKHLCLSVSFIIVLRCVLNKCSGQKLSGRQRLLCAKCVVLDWSGSGPQMSR